MVFDHEVVRAGLVAAFASESGIEVVGSAENGERAQYALFTMQESVEHRVRKAGLPPGAAQAARDELHADERAAAAARYAARYRS